MNLRRNIILMYGISFLQGLVFYGSIATLYRQAAGINIFQITLIESISFMLCILFELPWGMIAERIGYKHVMIIACFLYFISKIVFWKADSFFDFLAERILLSVVCAGLSGCDSAILYISCNNDKSQKVFGIYNNLSMLGLMTASAVFAVYLGNDYRMSAFLTIFPYGLAMLLALGLKEVRRPEAIRRKTFKTLVSALCKDGKFIPALIGMGLLNETHQTVTVFLNQLQYKKCGIAVSSMGYILILVTFLHLCGIFSFNFTKWLGVRKLSLLIFNVAAVSCFIMVWTNNAFLSIVCICAISVAYSLFQPLQMEIQNRQIVVEERAAMLSSYAVILESTAAVTNVVFGKVAQVNLSYAMFFGGVCCILGGFLFLRYRLLNLII